jgi:hypothetical protein
VSGSLETDNIILAADKAWSNSLKLHFHPSVVINNNTYTGNIKGQDLAFAICYAY